MLVEIRPPFWYPFHADEDEQIRFEVSSVGVWIIVEDKQKDKYFLSVQQADIPDNPWGIPAGKVKPDDESPEAACIREVLEETGLEFTENRFRYLTFIWSAQRPEKGHLLYFVETHISELGLVDPHTQSDGTIIFEPSDKVDLSEISQLALVPLNIAFEDNIINLNPYHPKETYKGYTALRRLGIIQGSFASENDPGL